MANLKCELLRATNDTEVLPVYKDTPTLQEVEKFRSAEPDRLFTLSNIFQEIDFVAQAQFTLDVTTTNAANPSLNFINPYATMATNLTLSVGGQFSDAPHRNLNIYTSVDTERLIASEPSPLYEHVLHQKPSSVRLAQDSSQDPECGAGSELAGDLGLKEILAASLIAERMNDVAVFEKKQEKDTTVHGVAAPDTFSNFAFGQIATQVDFTIIEGINGGPAWTLTKFKGPTGMSGPFASIQRQVKDTLVITLLPVCIREKYFPTRWDPTNTTVNANPYNQLYDPKDPLKIDYPMEYTPEMDVGTPGWANYLPPCNSPAGQQAKVNAPAKAQANNYAVQSQGLLQQLPAVPGSP